MSHDLTQNIVPIFIDNNVFAQMSSMSDRSETSYTEHLLSARQDLEYGFIKEDLIGGRCIDYMPVVVHSFKI